MSIRHYQGAALCWNSARLNFYNAACDSIQRNNLGFSHGLQYQCYGIEPGKFWENLENGGENVCVCSFYSADGITDWTFVRSWGVCNGACLSASFGCDGSKPVALNKPPDARSMLTMGTESASALVDALVPISSSLSPVARPSTAEDLKAHGNAAATVTIPRSTTLKALLLVVITLLNLGT